MNYNLPNKILGVNPDQNKNYPHKKILLSIYLRGNKKVHTACNQVMKPLRNFLLEFRSLTEHQTLWVT